METMHAVRVMAFAMLRSQSRGVLSWLATVGVPIVLLALSLPSVGADEPRRLLLVWEFMAYVVVAGTMNNLMVPLAGMRGTGVLRELFIDARSERLPLAALWFAQCVQTSVCVVAFAVIAMPLAGGGVRALAVCVVIDVMMTPVMGCLVLGLSRLRLTVSSASALGSLAMLAMWATAMWQPSSAWEEVLLIIVNPMRFVITIQTLAFMGATFSPSIIAIVGATLAVGTALYLTLGALSLRAGVSTLIRR